MKSFKCCNCDSIIFFENTACGNCGCVVGFIPDAMKLFSFKIEDNGQWNSLDRLSPETSNWKPCLNYQNHNVCNWMVKVSDETDLCLSCHYTEIIPALHQEENHNFWYLLESAKRRLFYTLLTLNLPIPSRIADPVHGLAFQFKEDQHGQEKVVTGHDFGVITINIAEADDVTREARRKNLHEPYRTLLGHMRHEIGHFYWDILISGSLWLEPFRNLFGDERTDYAEAVQNHYSKGSPLNWTEDYISSYATMHPWEDWAETWAHYFHIFDALETADQWCDDKKGNSFSVNFVSRSPMNGFRDTVIKNWLPLSQFINGMNRSLGQKDSYPFLLSDKVIEKLGFIHTVITQSQNFKGDCLIDNH